MKKRNLIILIILAAILIIIGIGLIIFLSTSKKSVEEPSYDPNSVENLLAKKTVQINNLEFSNMAIRPCDEEWDETCEINLDDYNFTGDLEIDVEHPYMLTVDFKNLTDQTIPEWNYSIILKDENGKERITLSNPMREVEGSVTGELRILTPVNLSQMVDYEIEIDDSKTSDQ